jgi:hypothetical protein
MKPHARREDCCRHSILLNNRFPSSVRCGTFKVDASLIVLRHDQALIQSRSRLPLFDWLRANMGDAGY